MHNITSGSGHTGDISSLPAVLKLLSGGEDWGLAPGILLSTGEHTKQRRLGSCFKSREGDFPGGPVVKNPPAMQGTWIRSLVQEYSTCHGAAKPPRHNYGPWAP